MFHLPCIIPWVTHVALPYYGNLGGALPLSEQVLETWEQIGLSQCFLSS